MADKLEGDTEDFSTPADVVKQTEDYVNSHNLPALFRGMSLETFKARPEKPVAFLVDYLIRLDPAAVDEVLKQRKKAAEAGHEELPEGPRVTVSHSDVGLQEYLVNQVGLATLTQRVAEALVAQRPPGDAAIGVMMATLQDIVEERKEEALGLLNKAKAAAEEAEAKAAAEEEETEAGADGEEAA